MKNCRLKSNQNRKNQINYVYFLHFHIYTFQNTILVKVKQDKLMKKKLRGPFSIVKRDV